MAKTYTVTVTVEVIEPEAVLQAAHDLLRESGIEDDLSDMTVEQALVNLIDPGFSVPGLSVQDSSAECLQSMLSAVEL